MCAAWVFLRLFGLEAGYPAVPLITYTLFVLPVAVLATLVALVLRQWPAAGLAGVATVVLAAVIAPRAIGGPDSMQGMPLRVMSANVLAGRGDAKRLAELARDRDTDVLCVEELTPGFARRLEAAGIEGLLPEHVLSVRKGVRGSGIFSRFPLRDLRLHGIASTGASMRVAPGLEVDMTAVHNLPVPTSPSGVDGWGTSLRRLPDASANGAANVLAGDFNATIDQSNFRDLLDQGYYDAAERMGDGLQPTWPAIRGSDRYLPVTIDHILYDRDRVGVRDFQVMTLPGSDHRTIYAELILSRSASR
jgi:endonuclease/exonuclease/phosphatase (EEP) superfamily protein YafD